MKSKQTKNTLSKQTGHYSWHSETILELYSWSWIVLSLRRIKVPSFPRAWNYHYSNWVSVNILARFSTFQTNVHFYCSNTSKNLSVRSGWRLSMEQSQLVLHPSWQRARHLSKRFQRLPEQVILQTAFCPPLLGDPSRRYSLYQKDIHYHLGWKTVFATDPTSTQLLVSLNCLPSKLSSNSYLCFAVLLAQFSW